MKKNVLLLCFVFGVLALKAQVKNDAALAVAKANAEQYFPFVKAKALEVMKAGFNAGDGYREVWIRDYNTFIELAAQVNDKAVLKENLLVFFRMQGSDGNIMDGFTPIKSVGANETDFIRTAAEPRYAGHKNTVETDQETSLVQCVYKYIKLTNDRGILDEVVEGKTVLQRLEWAMDYLLQNRFNKQYGLITGATTADWGDVQPEHGRGVDVDDNTHVAIDIYDNAMFIVALQNLAEMDPAKKQKWQKLDKAIAGNCKKYLWDSKRKKFIPHIYLSGSPFPASFDENEVYYFGGTTVAIEAGLLTKAQVKEALDEMVRRVKLAGAASIGLTLYPPYPEGYFKNKIMNPVYNYQNGGDWTWFGGRMIQQLIKYGYIQQAYEQILPMVKRVQDNNGFYEWYSVDNKPRGSGTFRGEAGVLYTAIVMFEKLGK